jgi:methyltransferase-like protein
LANRFLGGYVGADLIEFSAGPFPFVTEVSDRPEVCPYARAQAASGRVTNRRHEVVGLNPLEAATVKVLDGRRGHGELLDSLVEMAMSDQLSVREGDGRIVPPEEIRPVLESLLESTLRGFARAALLIR